MTCPPHIYTFKTQVALADVLAAQARGDAFVPYRNHPLTHLLRPSLEWARSERGDRRQYTVMLGAVGPSALSFKETNHVLRLVAQAGVTRASPRPPSAVDALARAQRTARAKAKAAATAKTAAAAKASAAPQYLLSAQAGVAAWKTDTFESRAVSRARAPAAAQKTRSRRAHGAGWRFHVPAVRGAATRVPTPAVKGRGIRKHVRLEWAPAPWLAPKDGSEPVPDVRDIYLEGDGSVASEDGAVPYWQRASGVEGCGSGGESPPSGEERELSPSRRRTVVALPATQAGNAPLPASLPLAASVATAANDGGVVPAESMAVTDRVAPAHSLKDSLLAREKAMLLNETAEQATVIATLVDALDSGHGDDTTHSVAARIAVIAQSSPGVCGDAEGASVAALHATLGEQHKTIGRLISAHHRPAGANAAPAVSAALRGEGTPHKAARPAALDAARAQAALDEASAARALYQRSEISARAAVEEAASLRSELIDAQHLTDAAESAASATVRAAQERERTVAAAGDAALSQAVRDAVASATSRLEAEHRDALDRLSSSSAERAIAAATAKLEAEHRRALEALEQQHLIDIASAAHATEAAASLQRRDDDETPRALRTPVRGDAPPPDFSTPLPSERRLALLALQREEATFLRGQAAVYDAMAAELDEGECFDTALTHFMRILLAV